MKIPSLAKAALLGSAALALAAGNAVADKKPDKSSDSTSASTSKIAKALKGKLVRIEGGKAVDHELKGSPEYYVVYHSASW